MKILVGHNYYQIAGGEDAVVRSEIALLQSKGHGIYQYSRDNTEFFNAPAASKFSLASSVSFSRRSYQEVRDIIRRFKPDLAHFHNIYYLLSPSVYFACQEERVPVVQSLHNFRMLCANGLFFRQGRVCEDCLNKSLWQGFFHGCFRQSRIQSYFLIRALKKHWDTKTWIKQVDAYITATDFAKAKYVAAGIPAEKISIKPNFIEQKKDGFVAKENFALYVGRLSKEKGIEVLLKAWKSVHAMPLKVIGDGDLYASLKQYLKAEQINNVELLGYVSQKECEDYMLRAQLGIVPSLCYENFPRVVVEFYSYKTPVFGSRLGTLSEVINEGQTGGLFNAGDPSDLAQKINEVLINKQLLANMQDQAYRKYLREYSDQKNYDQLISIYQKAVKDNAKKFS